MTEAPYLIVDTATLYFRAYFGVPKKLVDASGRPVNALHGLLDMLARLIDQYSPARVICCWDVDWRPAWRVDLVPSYKAHRLAPRTVETTAGQPVQLEAVEDELAQQVPWIKECLDAVGLPVAGASGYEADDVAGTLARRLAASGEQVIVVTGDRDLFQVVGSQIKVAYVARGVARHELVDDAWLVAAYGIIGAQYADFATLRGDPSDGLPGVAGIGAKTAAALLNRYGDLDAVLEAASDPASQMALRQRQQLTDAAAYLRRARLVVAAADVGVPSIDISLPPGRADLVRSAELAAGHNVRGPMSRLLKALGESWPAV